MKTKSFTTLSLLLLCALIFNACRKEKQWMTNAVITGTDGSMCACCGGLFVVPADSAHLYSGKIYVTDGLPPSFPVDSPLKFPLYVRINWEAPGGTACANRMTITDIEHR